MLDIIRRYRNGQAAHKKSVLLNSALIKLNNVLSDDARANAILEYIYDTVNQQSPSLGRVINAFGQCSSWVNFNDEMPAIGADIVVLVMQDGRVKTLLMFAVTTANIENIMQTDYPCYWVYQPSEKQSVMDKCIYENMFADTNDQHKSLHIMRFSKQTLLTVYNGFDSQSVRLGEHECERLKTFLQK